MIPELNRRILICDDTPSIHEDFDKILSPVTKQRRSLASMVASMKGNGGASLTLETPQPSPVESEEVHFAIEHAYQGKEAFEKVKDAKTSNTPYALTYMDVRMPPGWDGIETIKHIWECDENIEVVICTAYSDYSWEEIIGEFGNTDKLQFLRKPADFVSIKQMALALTSKWNLSRRSRQYTEDLEVEVAARTRQLSQKIREVEKAMEEIRQLRGIVPMCSYCHKIRDDENFWRQVDDYIRTHTDAEISHGVCPDCYEKIMGKPLI